MKQATITLIVIASLGFDSEPAGGADASRQPLDVDR